MTALTIILGFTAYLIVAFPLAILIGRVIAIGNPHERPREHQSRQEPELTGAGGGADFLSIHAGEIDRA